MFPDLKLYYKPIVTKIVQYWHKNRHIDEGNGRDSAEANPHVCRQLIWQRSQQHTIGKGHSLINGVKKTEQPHAKELNWTTTLYHTQKLIQNGSYWNIKAKTIKFLEANMSTNLQDLGVRQSLFWYVTKMTRTKLKNDNLDFMKI